MMAEQNPTSFGRIDPPDLAWQQGVGSQHNMYELAVLGGPLPGGFYSPAMQDRVTGSFPFRLAPQEIDETEPPAATLTFLQGKGVHIEDHGQRMKMISVAGTTGFRSEIKKAGFTLPILNIPVPFTDVKDARGLPVGEKTGFDRLVELKNLERDYHVIKNPKAPPRLVWYDGVMGEAWLVQLMPPGIRVTRSSRSPMMARYQFLLLGYGRVSDLHGLGGDIGGTLVGSGSTRLSGFESFMKSAKGFANDLQTACDFAESVIDRSVNIAKSTIGTILSPARILVRGLNQIVGAGARILDIPRDTVRMLAADAFSVVETLRSARASMRSANPFFQFTNPFADNGNPDPFYTDGTLSRRQRFAGEMGRIARIATMVAADGQFFASTAQRVIAERLRPFAARAQNSGARAAFYRAPTPTGSAMRYEVIRAADDIQSMARRLLQDSTRWHDLVIVNGLRPPYIADDGDGRNVLRPGDRLMWLGPAGSGDSHDVSDGNGAAQSAEDRLGQDLLATHARSPRVGLAIKDGDLDAISGYDNYGQAMDMAIRTPIGSVPLHPSYGVGWTAGDKDVGGASLVALQVAATTTIGADPRTVEAPKIRLAQSGNRLNISVLAKCIGASAPMARLVPTR